MSFALGIYMHIDVEHTYTLCMLLLYW